jgi:hypothetical protein
MTNPTLRCSVISSGMASLTVVRPPERPARLRLHHYDVSKKLTDTERLQQMLDIPLAGGALGVQTYASPGGKLWHRGRARF